MSDHITEQSKGYAMQLRHMTMRQLSLDYNHECPMCKLWFPMEQLHEARWVNAYSVTLELEKVCSDGHS